MAYRMVVCGFRMPNCQTRNTEAPGWELPARTWLRTAPSGVNFSRGVMVHVVWGPSQVWGSGGDGRLRVCIVSGLESLSEAGAERPIVDGAANLKQTIGPASRPTHLL